MWPPQGQSWYARIGLRGWLRRIGRGGRSKKGFAVLAEALAAVDKTGLRFYEAELYRLKGELTLQSKRPKSKVEPGRTRSRGMFSEGY